MVIIVVEGPSAAGKTTWCKQHAPRWLPEPGRWSTEEIHRFQLDRWQQAVSADAAGEVIVLDGDPFKLYYDWAQRQLDQISESTWSEEVDRARNLFNRGAYGLADVVLYSDPGIDELTRRKSQDTSRRRRNFERHTAMRPYFRQWYEAVASLDPARVIWHLPATGIPDTLIALGPRQVRSGSDLFDRLMQELP